MRHITTLLILIFSTSIFAQNNVVKTAGVSYTAGAPTFSPGRTGSQVAIDTVTGLWYEHNGTSWSASGYRVQTISGCSAPAYTPAKYQSRLVINACTAGQGGPELYYYTGSAWLQINEGQTYTAGTGIDITGTTITNTAPNVVQELSISGHDLSLSLGGGTVTLPSGSISRTARGDSLVVGVTKVMDRDNPGNIPFYLRNNLKWTDVALSKVFFNTGGLSIILLGDSYIEQENISTEFKKLLQEKMSLSGPGFLQAKDIFRYPNTAGVPNSLSASGWTVRGMTGTPMGRGLSMHSVVSGVSSTPFYWLPQSQTSTMNIWNTIELWYYGQAGGATLTVEIDSVNVGSVNTSTLSGFQKATFSVATNKQHSVKVTPSGAGAEILGFNAFTSGVNGVRVNSVGQAGAKASHYLSVDTSIWNKQFRALSPNLVFLNLGTNNRAAGQSLTAFKTEMKSMVQMIKRAKPDIDICLVGQVDVISTFGTPIASAAAYNEVLRGIAIEDSLAYFNTDQLYGSFLDRTQASKGALMSVDGIHPSTFGGYVIANNVITGMAPFLRVNLTELFLKTFGAAAPLNSSGHSANKFIITDASGNAGTSVNFYITGGNSFNSGGNINAANEIRGLQGKFGSPSLNGTFNALGNSSINTFGFAKGVSCFAAGFSGGVSTVSSGYGSIAFQNSNQGSIQDMFSMDCFLPTVGKSMPNNRQSILRLLSKIENMNSNAITNSLYITSPITQSSAVTNHKHVGINVAIQPTQTNGVEIVGIADSIGNNYFNYVSGNTAIGLPMLNSSPAPTARLHLGGGTAAAGTAPQKFTSGTDLTTPEAGALEYNGTDLKITNTAAAAAGRRELVARVLKNSATLDFSSTLAAASSDLTVTVTGAAVGDIASVGIPASPDSNSCYTAWVSATNTVTVRFNNYSALPVDPASGTFNVIVTKY